MSTELSAVVAALRDRQSFVITSHARPDGDAIGSSMALALALERLNKRARVILRDPIPAPYAGFPGVERIERLDRAAGPADAAVVLECSDLARPEVAGLSDYFIINIDHHEGNEMYGAVNWFDPSSAACGEMVADVIDALGVPWNTSIAAHLYLAIATDTGGLRYGPISPQTFEFCRRIAATGVNTAQLSRQIFDSFSLGRVTVMGAMLSRMSLHHGNRVAVLRLDDALLEENGATIDDTEGLVNVPLGAREIAAVALIKQQAENVFRVSLRSKGTVDVRLVAARWDGGGHHNAAGCTMTGTFDDVREKLVVALGEALSASAGAAS